jgi:hypothetical protein
MTSLISGVKYGGYKLWQWQSNSYASFSTYTMDQCPLEVTVKWALHYIFDRNKKSTATTNSFDLIMATRKVLD